VPSRRVEERRSAFQRYKEDVKREGKPFYPYAMFHDTVMSLVVVSVIVGLACVWHFTADGTKEGLLGPEYADKADPGTTSFVPRPDWYFYFLFYLLRIFKWPNSVILGTVGIPTIALLLLLAIPFIDVRRERRLLRRPVVIVATVLTALSMGVLTYKGATAEEALGVEVLQQVPGWVKKENLTQNATKIEGAGPNASQQAVAGARLFATSGCLNCHTYLGIGSPNLGAPDLTDEGTKGKGISFQIEHLKCPSCVNKGSPMPSYAVFPDSQLRELATFLEASKGEK
jgi:quinol---cytochrome c reductase cytochrome c subunit, bacillus type